MAGKTFVTAGDNRDDYAGFNPIYGADVDAFETLGDTVGGGQLSLQISGNAGADYIIGNTSVKAAGGEAGDTLYGGLGNDTLLATTVAGSTAINIMDGGAGNDNITGGIWADSLVGGAGNDSIRTGANPAAAIDTLFGGDGNDTLDALANVFGQSYLSGDAGDDRLVAGTIGTTLLGGAGNDKILGGAGADSIFGGTGNDSIEFSAGNDSVFFAKGDGADTIGKAGGGVLVANQLVSFTDAAVADITVGGSDSAYTIGISGTTDSIKISRGGVGVADPAATLKASGTAFTIADADNNGGGFSGATYNSNVKLYAGYATETDDLVKTVSGTGAGTFDLTSSSFYSVEQFDNSANWFGGSKIRGTAGADSLIAAGSGVIGTTGDQLWGRAGNDTLVAGGGSDTLWYGAGEGNDYIKGSNKNDVINLYNVNSSAVTYRLETIGANTNLVISIAGQTDKLVIENWNADKAKIATQDKTTPFDPVVPNGDTLVFAASAGAQTIDLNDYSTASHIDNSADTTGGSKFRGTAVANRLVAANIAGVTGDQLWGRGGYDTLDAGVGADTLWVGSGEGDKVVTGYAGKGAPNVDILKAYNSTLANLSFSDNVTNMYATFQDNGNQVKFDSTTGAVLKVATSDFASGKYVSVAANNVVNYTSDVAGAGTTGYHYGSSGTDALKTILTDGKLTLDLTDSTKFVNIENINNAANTTTGSKLRGTNGDNKLIAGTNGDQLWGRNGTDTLVGGAGADTFWAAAGEGNKTIQGYDPADVDVLKLYAAKLTDLTFTDNGAKTTIGYGSGSDTLTLDATTNKALIVQTTDQAAGKTVHIAVGTNGNVDYTDGDYHYGNNGKNTLRSTAVVATTFDLEDATKFNGIVNIDATGMVVNANGTVMRGTSGDNKLQASNNAGDGTALWGRGGDDTLVGGTAAASDVFWYGKDEGADVIQNFLVANDKVMLYTSGLTTADVAVAVSGNDVIFTIGTGTLKVTDGAKAGSTSLMIGDTSGLIQLSDGNSYNVVSEGSGYVLKLK